MSLVVMVTQQGEEHGLLSKIANSVKPEDAYKNMSPEQRAEMEKKRKEDNKLVKARFVHRREENGKLEKPYVKHAGDPIQIWKFINGYEYEVPRGLVEEVNSYKLPKRSKEESDIKKVKDVGSDTIFEFVPVSW